MARVLVAAGSSIQRRLIGLLLDADPAFEVVGQADDGAEALDLAVRFAPDLIAMDLHMPGGDAVDVTREIMARAPTRIAILCSVEDDPDLGRGAAALQAGAVMVVPKPGRADGTEPQGGRGLFLEMMRAALRRDVPSDFEPGNGAGALDSFSFDSFDCAADFAATLLDASWSPPAWRQSGAPFTQEDRARRIRELLDAGDQDGFVV